jgi:aspartate ammonia-lyase
MVKYATKPNHVLNLIELYEWMTVHTTDFYPTRLEKNLFKNEREVVKHLFSLHEEFELNGKEYKKVQNYFNW